MSVVNVKVKHIRPQGYLDLKHWCEGVDNVYIGRPGVVFVGKPDGTKERFPKQGSKWANPFKISNNGYTRETSLDAYEQYIRQKILEDPLRYDLNELKGKALGCWCKPERCHGDILEKLCRECAQGQ